MHLDKHLKKWALKKFKKSSMKNWVSPFLIAQKSYIWATVEGGGGLKSKQEKEKK